MRFGMAVMVAMLVGCGGGEDSDTKAAADDCSACADDEVCVAYLGGDEDYEECVAMPSECGSVASCGDNACISALYGLCENSTIGVGCSDTFPPTIVSCNP